MRRASKFQAGEGEELVIPTLKFPSGFYWGASTSAHQVEGGNHNDWTVWEEANASDLAHAATSKYANLPAWQQIKKQAQKPANYLSGAAADHYHRFAKDFDILTKLNLNAYRFSIEWSRIEPIEGQFNQAALDHYRAVVKALRARKIEPFVTLWHWTHPIWFAAQGGWATKTAPHYFERFCKVVAEALGSDVKFWITLNEPENYVNEAYRIGIRPPQYRSLITSWQVLQNLITSHNQVYKLLKRQNKSFKIGLSKTVIDLEAHRERLVNRALKSVAGYIVNDYVLNKTHQNLDFIGVNYYFRNQINYGFNRQKSQTMSDIGWDLHPEGIYDALISMKKYGLPVVVTENGLADAADRHRGWYINQIAKSMILAIQAGVKLRGYLHWSLLDNFEWEKGFWPRFGLVAVDYKTQQRLIRPSAKVYAQIAKNGNIKL